MPDPAEGRSLPDQERRAASEKIWRRFNGYGPGIADEAGRLQVENDRLREAVALHAGTLDDRALGHPEHNKRDRDSIDNELYHLVRRVDPSWWNQRVPGMGGSPRPIDEAHVAAPCGRLLVGQGDETYDPLCVLPTGHTGLCKPEDGNHG